MKKRLPVNKIICGDVLNVLQKFPDKSINMVMTSPPYWGLRDYGEETETIWDGDEDCNHKWSNDIDKKINLQSGNDEFKRPWREKATGESSSSFCKKCGAWKGQLGLEPNFDLYIKHLCDIFDEIKHVLRDDGTVWVNIGDTYSGGGGNKGIPDDWDSISTKNREKYSDNKPSRKTGLPDKCLTMIPFRFAIEMVNRGWILRNTIIWHKESCMPSSVKDRFTVDFEYLFFFSKKKKYYFEQQFDDYKTNENRPMGIVREREFGDDTNYPEVRKKMPPIGGKKHTEGNKSPTYSGNEPYYKKGRNKRTTWSINPKPFPDAHFAVFPPELCETPIKAGCPEDGIVLDPFVGSGTTCIVARKLLRNYIGIDVSEKYCQMAQKRLQKIPERLEKWTKIKKK